MTFALPLTIVGVGGAIAMLFIAFRDQIIRWVADLLEPYLTGLDRAAIPGKTEELAVVLLVMAVVPWGIIEIFLRPSWPIAIAMLLFTISAAFLGIRFWIKFRIMKRLAEFNDQLEMVLRLVAGTMRVGLGLRQAMVQVVADMPDPSRMEFMRVVSQTQIGVSLYDALDALSARMPSSEMALLSSVVRLQSKTGGSLSRVLENLADTIKERRRLQRKIRTLTAEARMTKYIITALPLFVGLFIVIVEPDIRQGLLFTFIGRCCVAAVIGLLTFGWFLFEKISNIDL